MKVQDLTKYAGIGSAIVTLASVCIAVGVRKSDMDHLTKGGDDLAKRLDTAEQIGTPYARESRLMISRNTDDIKKLEVNQLTLQSAIYEIKAEQKAQSEKLGIIVDWVKDQRRAEHNR